MSSNLNSINFGLNQYCGPSVLSALTGRSTDECAAVLSAVSGKTTIKAIDMKYIIEAVKKLRFDISQISSPSQTLFGTLSFLSHHEGLYLILVPRHIVAVEVSLGRIYLVDNHSKSPVNAAGSARLTQRVEQLYKVTPKEQPVYISTTYKFRGSLSALRIYKIDRYQNPEDNVETYKGLLNVTSSEELEKIYNAIGDYIHASDH